MSCLCVWAHSWAHTSILVSSLCVPGLWKCQIIRLEGRRPPGGGTQKMWGGGGGMVPFVQLSLSTALLHHHSTLKLPVILFSLSQPPGMGKKSVCCLKAISHILIYFCILPFFMSVIFTPSWLFLLCISSHFFLLIRCVLLPPPFPAPLFLCEPSHLLFLTNREKDTKKEWWNGCRPKRRGQDSQPAEVWKNWSHGGTIAPPLPLDSS